MAGNSSFDEILTTTLRNYIPKLTDNIFSARPLFYALTNGQTIRRISGGSQIIVPSFTGPTQPLLPTVARILLPSRLRRASAQLNTTGASTRPR